MLDVFNVVFVLTIIVELQIVFYHVYGLII